MGVSYNLPKLNVSGTKRAVFRSGSPHVALCVDQFRSHGRGVMRGIAEYVETYGPWSLFIDPLADSSYPQGRSEN